MHSIFSTCVQFAGFVAFTFAPLAPAMPYPTLHSNALAYDIDTAYTRFELPARELASPLVLELQIHPVQESFTSDITLDRHSLPVQWDFTSTSTDTAGHSLAFSESRSLLISVPDRSGVEHAINLTFAGSSKAPPNAPEDEIQSFTFEVTSIDDSAPVDSTSFIISTRPASQRRLRQLLVICERESISVIDESTESFMVDDLEPKDFSGDVVGLISGDDFDFEAEIESLLLLETQAGDLNAQVAAKKQRIANCLKDHRDRVSLRKLLEECDGVVCAAKVIAQKICDKVGFATQPSFSYVNVQNSHTQNLITFEDGDEKLQQKPQSIDLLSEKHVDATQPALLPVNLTKSLDWTKPSVALIKVLEIIAAALGLTALAAFVKRKCMSARTRAERAADREERRNARAYRRAARRADMRRRWDAFMATMSCFKQENSKPVMADYEEKRALILQDALLEQELDHAEKGEVMEAEIRELRHAHEIVASLVRVDERRYDLAAARNDPPPSVVPLPYTPASRSRASTGTLPSYTSESLPGYTSRVVTEVGSSNSSDAGSSLPSATNSAEYNVFSGSTGNSVSGRSAFSRGTLTSSIIDTSPRPSQDTLRTRQSKDTSYL